MRIESSSIRKEARAVLVETYGAPGQFTVTVTEVVAMIVPLTPVTVTV